MLTRSLPVCALLVVSVLSVREGFAQSSPPAQATTDGMHSAPIQATPNTPSEGSLTPPPDADKAELPAEFVTVRNPAFPTREAPTPVVHRGRRIDLSDLAPYFADGKLADARAELEAGRPARARALLADQGDAVPVRYLRAVAALRAGDDAAAAPEMEALVPLYPALADRCLTHAGLAREGLNDFAKAAELFAQVPDTSKLYADARLGLSRVKARQNDLDGAIAALEPLAKLNAPGWGRDLGAEALIATADLQKKKKDRAGEQAALVALWSKHPLSPLADQAMKRLGSAAKIPDEAKVARGEALVEAHRNKAGLDALEPLLAKHPLPDALGCRAQFTYGKGLRKERRHTEAIRFLTPVVERCTEDADLRTRAMYVLGSSRSIVDTAHGAETYEQLAKEFPSHPFADDALFYAADLDVKNGNLDSALVRLDQLGKLYPNGDFASEGLFKAFWIHKTRGDFEKAFAVLDRIEEIFGKSDETYDLERARYWRARLTELTQGAPKAIDLFAKVALDHPATYYGLLARVRLAELSPDRAGDVVAKLTPATPKSPWPLFAGPMSEDPHFVAGIELMRLGFEDAASTELLAVPRANQPEEPLRLLVQLLSMSGETRGAHAVARSALRRDLSGPISAETRPVWEVAYPNAFRPLIEKHCNASGFDPDLLQALMREESALDPKALSWAGALGLTQLMPSTAKQVARGLGVKSVNPKALLEPDLNIRLGAALLGSLLKRFQGNRAFALAGYNAGALAVDRWRPAGEKPLDEWVEEIPIAETRGYVKRVLRTFNTYQLLYGRTRPVTSIEVKPDRSADARDPAVANDAG